MYDIREGDRVRCKGDSGRAPIREGIVTKRNILSLIVTTAQGIDFSYEERQVVARVHRDGYVRSARAPRPTTLDTPANIPA